ASRSAASWRSGSWTTALGMAMGIGRGRRAHPLSFRSALLIAQIIDEFHEFDRLVVVGGLDRLPGSVLAVGKAIVVHLVLGRRLEEGLGDRRLQVVGQVRKIS